MIDFETSYLQNIPLIFTPLTPFIHFVRDTVLSCNGVLGLPWWLVIMITSVATRIIVFPLIIAQYKKTSKIGPVFPVYAHIKETWKQSSLPFHKKLWLSYKLYNKLAIQEGFRLKTICLIFFSYYPILIIMIYGLRSIIGIE